MKDDNDPRSPFVVPGHGIPEPQPRRTPQASGVPKTPTNPFRWVVPDKPTSTGQEGNLDNESNPTTRVSSPALPGQAHGDGNPAHVIWQRPDHDDNLNPTVGSSLVPSAPNPQPGGDTQSNGLTNPNPETEGAKEVTGNRIVSARDETEGARVATLGDPQSRLWTGVPGGNGTIDLNRLREGVQIGTVKRELLDHRPRSKRRAPRPKKHYPFSPQIPKILDFLTRWRIGTTVQLARVAGWKDSNEQRLVKKLRVYDEVGFMRETDIYAGPKIWTATEHGAELGFHSWLGGVKSSEINPMSQSHSFGLSSIASWLLCPWDETPNILGLSPDEWSQVRSEIKDGTAILLAEKEYRSSYSSIRTTGRGLLPPEYRHGFIGGPGGQSPVTGAWREWARSYKNGDSTLAESPELLACDPEFMGANMWMWIIWGNGVWNPKVLETRAAGDGIDVDDPEWAGRDGKSRLLSEFRQYGFVDIEERLDVASNKPMINKELGDKFALWDHLPDLIIARRRTDDEYADPQSIAIELELSAKTPEAYARTMAAYGSPLGQTLFAKVIWLVSSKTIADRIREGARQVGMVLGEDYEIVPFVTSNKVSVVKSSFYSGVDILPGKWSRSGRIEPSETGMSIPLS